MVCHDQSICVRAAATLTAAFVALCATKAAAVDACTQTTSLSGGTSYTSDGSGNVGSAGYNYELWHDGSGSMTMTVYGGTTDAFKAAWNNAGDFLAREGLKWNETATYDTYGNVIADFNFTKSGSGGGYSYMGIYGWSNNPLVEYYIVENGFWTTPPNAASLGGATHKGTLDIDGGTYDIYTYQRVNKASIHGTATFDQFWSIRQTPRTCGHISISDHWKKWNSLGMTLGKMYEAKILVEAGGGQGTFDLTYATMQANAPTTSITPAPEAAPQLSKAGATSWISGKSGVLSLVSLNGSVVRSVRQDASSPAVIPTANLAKGVYLLRFQGENSVPETRKFLLD